MFYLHHSSARLIPLLLATSPRLLGYATAFSPAAANSSLPRNFIQSSSSKLFNSDSDSKMTDEVAAAKAAAAEYNPSENDGAGPATVFDNILSGKWPSDKVYEDDLALAFRE